MRGIKTLTGSNQGYGSGSKQFLGTWVHLPLSTSPFSELPEFVLLLMFQRLHDLWCKLATLLLFKEKSGRKSAEFLSLQANKLSKFFQVGLSSNNRAFSSKWHDTFYVITLILPGNCYVIQSSRVVILSRWLPGDLQPIHAKLLFTQRQQTFPSLPKGEISRGK